MQLHMLLPSLSSLCNRFGLLSLAFSRLASVQSVVGLNQHLCYLLKSLVDMFRCLSTRLYVANFLMLVDKGLHFFQSDFPTFLQIALVADEDARDVVRGVLLDFAHPVVDGSEGIFVRHIVGHDNSVCALVVRRGDGLEALLSSRVPLHSQQLVLRSAA